MRIYVWVTGLGVALLALAHLLRPLRESVQGLGVIEIAVTALLPTVFALWAFVLLRRNISQ